MLLVYIVEEKDGVIYARRGCEKSTDSLIHPQTSSTPLFYRGEFEDCYHELGDAINKTANAIVTYEWTSRDQLWCID